MEKYDIVLLTEAQYMNPTTIDWYTQQVLTEDQLVQEALEKEGLTVCKMNWDAPNFDWASTKAILFRTPWDYSHRFQEFWPWLEKVATQTKLINSLDQIKWNIDKHYLEDLKAAGISIPPTKIVEQNTVISLRELQMTLGWSEMVLKPAISAGGRHTYRLNDNNIVEHESLFQELISEEAMVLQPFLHNIIRKGEIALMVIDGNVTHAVLKRAKKGDFRVQDDFGGSVEVYTPSEEEIAFAERTVAACQEQPVYARVDLVWDNNNELALSEIELIEPEMWFRNSSSSTTQLAAAIAKKI